MSVSSPLLRQHKTNIQKLVSTQSCSLFLEEWHKIEFGGWKTCWMTRVKFRKQTEVLSCASTTDCLYILTFHRGSLTHCVTTPRALLNAEGPSHWHHHQLTVSLTVRKATQITQDVVLNQVGRGRRRNFLDWVNHRDILIRTQKKVEPNTNWLGSYRINNPCTEPLLKSMGGLCGSGLCNINARPCLGLHIQKRRRYWEQFP